MTKSLSEVEDAKRFLEITAETRAMVGEPGEAVSKFERICKALLKRTEALERLAHPKEFMTEVGMLAGGRMQRAAIEALKEGE